MPCPFGYCRTVDPDCERCEEFGESRAYAEYDRRVSEQEMNERADREAHWGGAA
jgi:hypothetical protein